MPDRRYQREANRIAQAMREKRWRPTNAQVDRDPLYEFRIYLNVPYAEKDEAKALGARWSPKTKRWFIKTSTKLDQFQKWLNT